MMNYRDAKCYLWALRYAAQSRVTQALSRNPSYPLEKFPSIEAFSEALLNCEYRGDTAEAFVESLGLHINLGNLGRKKFDFMRHVSGVMRGILIGTKENKVNVGDCEDYAAAYCAELKKAGLAQDVRLVCLWWVGSGGEQVGHMVCAYRVDGEGWWAGNWNKARPIKGEVIAGLERVVGSKVTQACSWTPVLMPDDSLVLANIKVLR